MTMPRGVSRALYAGNGQAVEFPFLFKVWEEDQLSVLLTSPAGVTTEAAGWSAELDEGGGTLTYLHNGAPLPEGWKLAIMRNMPFVQEVDLITGTRFDPEVIETALDVATAERQQLLERLDRAVVVEPTAEGGPEALLADIRDARSSATASATSAQASANAAANSSQSAAGSAAVATEEREAACVCAGEAKDARDVAIAQTEAANTLMEAELAKVNAIVAANRTDQQAAVEAARQWAEKEAGTPVEYDEDGAPLYSARHWAENAQKIAIEPPTAERRGSIRVGPGLHLETGENGETDVLAADLATRERPGRVRPDGVTTAVDADGLLSVLGGSLLLNEEVWITESGSWTAPMSAWFEVLLISGGQGALIHTGAKFMAGGESGNYDVVTLYLEAGQEVEVSIGAGGPSLIQASGATSWRPRGGVTTFDGHSPRYTTRLPGLWSVSATNDFYFHGGGFGASASSGTLGFYGAGGGGHRFLSGECGVAEGMQGAVRVRWHDPAKAAGPVPATFAARRMAPRGPSIPATVNLYDPATGQGSVWREEDAEAKLAEGLISEEAWRELCDRKAAQEREAWLADPASVAERFAMLRAARDGRLAATDYLVAPDYPLDGERRAAVTAYRQALRDLPEQEGAPWDGGGELTPWPAKAAFCASAPGLGADTGGLPCA